MFGYGFLYRDWDNDRGLFYDGQEKNLKYCLNAPEAQKWYDTHKDKMVSVDIKRPPDLMIPVKIPLETKKLLKKDIDTQFLQFITKGNVSTRMEMILNKFMDKYYFGVDGYFYRREQAGEEMAWSSRNIMTLIMMKETILGNFRITPLKIPAGKKRSNLAENEYAEWDLGDDLYAEYVVDGQKYGTNIFGTYIHKLFATMLPESDFNGRKLQKWQLDVLLRYGRLNYIIGPRSGGKCRGELEKLRMADGTFKLAKDIKVGDKLLASDKKGYVNVIDVDKFQKECVKVTLKDGTDFIVSKDHRIPTQDTYHNGAWDLDINNYTTAENLVPGKDFIPLMIENKEFNKAGDNDFEKGVLIGMLLGDGSLSQDFPTLTCVSQIKRGYIYNILDTLGYGYTLHADNKTIGIKGLSDFRKEYSLYGNSHEKEIANKIFGLSNRFKWGVISGMLWTDGYLGIKKALSSKRNQKDSPYIELASVNKTLARQLRVLMADVGLISYERQKHKKTHFKDGKEYETDFYYVFISDKESLGKVNNYCKLNLKQNYEARSKLVIEGAGDSHLQGNISVIPQSAFNESTVEGKLSLAGNRNRRLYNGIRVPECDFQRWKCANYGIEQWLEYSWSRVEKVEDVGLQNVVHIEVDGDHTYWGELDLTHNSLVMTGMSTAVLLKELTDYNERLQEFAVLYMGLSQKQNAPYMAYSMKMLNNLFTNLKIARKSEEIISIVDGDKKRNLEFITTNQDDPSRSRRTRFAVGDEADYLKWEYVKTLIGTPDSIVTLISTIDPKTQAGKFYDGWKNAYARQREYPDTIEQLIHRIRTEHGMDKCESRKDIQRKIDSGEMAQMRAEFLEARPVVALHYTMDDVEFLTEKQKKLQNETAMNVGGYEYMLAENYGEYATNTSVFTVDGKQQESPARGDYVILGYDEAENWDYPGFAAVIVSKEGYWVDDTWRLSHDPDERFAQMKQLFMNYKSRAVNGRVFFASDISRSEAIARELAMLGMPVNMKIRWGGNVDWKIDKGHYLVSKQRCTEMIQNIFFTSNTFHLDPKCYKEDGLVEEISHFKRNGTKIMGEHSKKDDQVSAMMACLFFLYQNEQLAMKNAMSAMPQMTNMQKAEMEWHNKYQRMDSGDNPLLNLKLSLF